MAKKWGESDSRFLKKEDIGNHTPVVEIESVKWEEIGEEKDEKPVLYFKGKSKGMVCNKTIQDELTALFGEPAKSDEPSLSRHFGGGRVQLYVDPTVRYAGKRVGGLRLRAASGETYPPADPEPEPEEPPMPEEPGGAIGDDADLVF